MSSKVAASLAELVVRVGVDRVGEVARRDLARGTLEPLDAPGQRARDDVAGQRGEHQRDRACHQDPLADQLDVRLHVRQRVGEHGHAAHLVVADERDRGQRLAPAPVRSVPSTLAAQPALLRPPGVRPATRPPVSRSRPRSRLTVEVARGTYRSRWSARRRLAAALVRALAWVPIDVAPRRGDSRAPPRSA
jgi:hypothetical protein